MSKKLTILVTPVEGVGHVNACIGVAQCLKDRGHRIVFVIDSPFAGNLLPYGFEEELLQDEESDNKKPGEEIANMMLQLGWLSEKSSLDKFKLMANNEFFNHFINKMKKNEPQMKAIVEKYNPDVILIDNAIGSPSLIYSNIPWVLIVSANPLTFIQDERTPPGGSGYPINGPRHQWNEFQKVREEVMSVPLKVYKEWMIELGSPIDNLSFDLLIPESPYLNIYGFPEELDYIDIRPLSDKWFSIDYFTRKETEDFKLPEILQNRDKSKEKLIYLSMGSMGSIDIELMQRLVNILSKTSHKYIVSKGLFGDKYELPDNMWGQKSVAQTKVIPLVDLVITHGGNNTVTETFSFGKPMIVMPLFADQYDNAQRVHEKGFGIRLDPFNCTEEELIEGIEMLLNDENLKKRLETAVKRMENSQRMNKAAQKIENLVN